MHLSILTLALAGAAAAKHVAMPFSREKFNVNLPTSITRRQTSNSSDNSILLQAINNMTGGGYYGEFGIGTPPQTIGFLLDTGSSDTWMNSAASNLCTSQRLQSLFGHCLEPCKSGTRSILLITWEFTY